jgi:hypothetical protein
LPRNQTSVVPGSQHLHLRGQAAADLGVATGGEELEQDRAFDLKDGVQLVEDPADSVLIQVPRQADRGWARRA